MRGHPDETTRGPKSQPHTVPESRGQASNAFADVVVLPWNDIDAISRAVQAHHGQIAGLIMEPIMGNTSTVLPKPGYLEEVREICAREEITLIFDEVITGFRVGLGGAQELLGMKPDLAIFAKAMANGFPISCLAGRRDLMDLLVSGNVTHAGTYNSNRVGCAAAAGTLGALRQKNCEAYARLKRAGTALMEGLREIARKYGQPMLVQGLPCMFHTTFTEQKEVTDYRSHQRCRHDLQSQFVCLLLDRGVRVTDRGTWFVSAAHTEQDVELTLKAAESALPALDAPGGAR